MLRWWIGGNDLGWEGNWTWIKSKQPVGDFVWHSGQPASGIKGNCLVLNYGASYEGYDASCTNSYYPICQLNI